VHCDVTVVGAGAAGIAAAIAAARAGAEVVLIEAREHTGGLASSAQVGTICGLFYRGFAKPRYAVQGFAREFAEAIQRESRTAITQYAEGLHFLPYRPDVFHLEALRQLQKAGVKVVLQTRVIGIQVDAQRIQAIQLQGLSQTQTIYPAAVIDCSGTSQVSKLADIERIQDTCYQAGAFVFQVSGLPVLPPATLALELMRWLKRGIYTGVLAADCERLSIIPGSVDQDGNALLKLGMPIPFDGSSACHNRYEQIASTRSIQIVDYLSRHEPLLSKLQITAMAAEVGIRTDERGQGIELLTEDQVLSCAKPDNGVALGVWPIEYWGAERKPVLKYFDVDDGYWIPAGALVSRNMDNLFFAGRALSATEMAIASARVMGTCLETGFAAGGLAAEFCQSGIWGNAIKAIQAQQLFAELKP